MKDRFHLDDIIYYGRSYPDLPPYLWWYCKNDGQIYDADTLKTEFHFSDEGEMEESPNFIPLFRTDIVSLEVLFLNQCGADALKKIKQQQEKEGIPFDTAFKIFEERLPVRIWHGFEKNKLREDAKKWCMENHIPFEE